MAGPYGLYNGMPGVGEAFLLQGNAAADAFNTNLSMQQKQARIEALQRQKMQAEQQQNITDNLSKISPGEYWINHDKEIKDNYQKVIDYGTELKNRNQDPFADKNFLKMKEDLLSQARFSKQLQDEYKVVADEIHKNPNGYENLDEVLSYYSPNRTLADYQKSGYQRPSLNRAYTLSDAIKDSDGKVSYVKNNDGTWDTTKINRAGIIDQALGSTDLESAKYLIKKSGGDSDAFTQGFPTVTANGGRVWNTNEQAVDDIAINTLATNAQFPEYLKSKGYKTESDDDLLKSAKEYIAKQNKAVGSYIESYTNKVAGTGTTDRTRSFAAEANRRANAESARAASNFNKSNEENKYLQDLKRNALNGDQDGINRLNAYLNPINGRSRYNNGVLEILVPIEEKRGGLEELFNRAPTNNKDTVTEGNKKYRRFKIGKNAGAAAEIYLDNLLKEVGLQKKDYTPSEYNGELDNIGTSDSLDDL